MGLQSDGQKSRLRVGAVSYLNTKPLVYALHDFAPTVELYFDLPSRLANALELGQVDVALVPSIEYLLHPQYRIISDACIACRGPVLSVKLLSRKPMSQITSLALDEGSRTSVVLARILLAEQLGVTPRMQPLPLDATAEDTDADAVLLIGDRAIHAEGGSFVEHWDLGEQWTQWLNLPFVFAMWTVRREVDLGELAGALTRARDAGVANLPEIASREAPTVRLTVAACLSYLRDNLHFYLGESEKRGLDLFRHYAKQLELAVT